MDRHTDTGITPEHWDQLAEGALSSVLATPVDDPARACALIFDEMHCQVDFLLLPPPFSPPPPGSQMPEFAIA